MDPLLEHLIVGLAVFGAAAVALRRWWPSKKRAAGCGSGCSSCGSADDASCGTTAQHGAQAQVQTKVETRVQTVAMPQSRRPAR
jgi:hypothetical protein